MQGYETFIFMGFLIAIFYFMLIRPQKRRVQQHRELIESVGVGDEIITIGGIYGTVRAIEDEEMQVEVSSGTTVRLTKSAIARRVTEDVQGEVSG